ncbi:putative protein TPRXL [Bradysia coprophila]|uniref:putative protein TPRXL n=1 Tax=Bradysia coprophila TaxID=38358 RepID=UPI00187DD626|nr:putative protein TPRXL [Bradysia coprophila]
MTGSINLPSQIPTIGLTLPSTSATFQRQPSRDAPPSDRTSSPNEPQRKKFASTPNLSVNDSGDKLIQSGSSTTANSKSNKYPSTSNLPMSRSRGKIAAKRRVDMKRTKFDNQLPKSQPSILKWFSLDNRMPSTSTASSSSTAMQSGTIKSDNRIPSTSTASPSSTAMQSGAIKSDNRIPSTRTASPSSTAMQSGTIKSDNRIPSTSTASPSSTAMQSGTIKSDAVYKCWIAATNYSSFKNNCARTQR